MCVVMLSVIVKNLYFKYVYWNINEVIEGNKGSYG